MDNSVLPPADRQLILFQRWLREWLTTVADAEHRKLLDRFATWHTLRKLRAAGAQRALGPGTTAIGRRTTNAFLRWCVANRTMPRLNIPHQRTENPAPISQ